MTERVCKVGTDCDVTCFCLPCRACFDHCVCLDSLEHAPEPGPCEEMASIPSNEAARDDGRGLGTK